MSEKFGKHGLAKPKLSVRSLATPVRMYEGMDEDVIPKKETEVLEGPVLSERDRAKMERRKRKEERQREVCALNIYIYTSLNHSHDCLFPFS